MKKLDVSSVPAEMVEALFGDENLNLESDELPINLENVIERATGQSFGAYSQEKRVLSDEVVLPSSIAPTFSEIFGERGAGEDEFFSRPQSSFMTAGETLSTDHTRFVSDPLPITAKKTLSKNRDSYHTRFSRMVEAMGEQDLTKAVPSELGILTEGAPEPLTQEQQAQRSKLFKGLAGALRKGKAFKFCLDNVENLMSEDEIEEYNRLTIVDCELFDCAFPV
jgi:hypothetical protein